MKIVVLMGGISQEREVSLASGVQVARALREAGEDALGYDTARGILSEGEEDAILASGVRDPEPLQEVGDLLRTGDLGVFRQDARLLGTDLVFPALHGGRGEDGTLQALLELAEIPFVGSDRVGCALSMDKDLSKRLLRDSGIPTPDWITLRDGRAGREHFQEVADRLGLPLIVKPPSGGSTLGLSLVHDQAEFRAAVELALEFQDQIMFEAYVRGREVTVGILGTEPLPVGEIIPAHELFDYECKYQPGLAQEIFPADLEDRIASELQAQALATHELLRLRDFSRVDFILDEDGTPWCLEANALPGLTGNSLLPKAAGAAEISFSSLCRRLAQMAFQRGERGTGSRDRQS